MGEEENKKSFRVKKDGSIEFLDDKDSKENQNIKEFKEKLNKNSKRKVPIWLWVIIGLVGGALITIGIMQISSSRNSITPMQNTPTSDLVGTIDEPLQEEIVKDSVPFPSLTSGDTQTFNVGGVEFSMVYVEGGEFLMGSNDSEASGNEKPAHKVTLNSYYIGETEVTLDLWQAIMGSTPCEFKGANSPVVNISWDECQIFIEKLNSRTSKKFRLPTEAEWEFAARGGNESRHYQFSGSNSTEDVAWYEENSGGTLHPVKTMQPNELGLYDMSGNVWEMCSDWYDANYYQNSVSTNPTGPTSGDIRVTRGGSWSYSRVCCGTTVRNYYSPNHGENYLGLRLVLLP